MDKDNKENEEMEGHDSDSSESSQNSETIESLEREIQELNENIATEIDQFSHLSMVLKKEKNNHIKKQFYQLNDGTLPEFAQPMEEMRKEKHSRLHRAKLFRDYKAENCKLKFDAEMGITEQDLANEKRMLIEMIQERIEQETKNLEEERRKADLEYHSDLYKFKRTHHDKIAKERRKKPITVTGTPVVYQLRDEEIDEDVNFITSIRMSSSS